MRSCPLIDIIKVLQVNMTPDVHDALCDVPRNPDGTYPFKLVWPALLSNMERGYISPQVRAKIALGMYPTPKGYFDPFPEKTNSAMGELLLNITEEEETSLFTFPNLPSSS